MKPGPGDGSAWGPSPWLLALAVGIVAGALAWWWSSRPAPADEGATAEAAASVPTPAGPRSDAASLARAGAGAGADGSADAQARAAVGGASAVPAAPLPKDVALAASATVIPRHRDPRGDQTPDVADYVNPGETPSMAEVIDRLHQAGVRTGLGAFQPPGTRPPLVGLAVPEGFPLPEGYVRHYQATDDGQRIEPILMFAPDHVVYDADHHPIALPPDRVVPPELAPPGLPIRRIVVPAPVDRAAR